MIKAKDVVVDGYNTPTVCRLTGVPPSTLDYWVDHDLVLPTVHPGTGRRATRWWSLQDIILIRSLRALREAGCPLQTMRKAKALIEDVWSDEVRHTVLCWTGTDLLVTEPWGDLRSAIRHPGQGVLHLVAIPLPQWREEAESIGAEKVNISHLRRLAENRKGRVQVRVTPIELRSRDA